MSKKKSERHLNNDIDALDSLVSDLMGVVKHLRRIKPVPLSKKQHKALNIALRALDGVNAYAEGDKLRKAFKVELDGLRTSG